MIAIGAMRALFLFRRLPRLVVTIDMPPDKRSALVRTLFESALEVERDRRSEWLVANCVDAQCRADVERLLAADDSRPAHVVEQAFDHVLDLVGEVSAGVPPVGSTIGAFTLHEQLGEGGSSVVFRASREQDGVKQVVALKLLRRNLYSNDERRRFRDERRALSQLQHPGIARLIEGGLTEAGTPYIALDLVVGESIIDHARSHALDVPQRLGLFIDVCRAVEAAHRALIVHRDLKPSNVMVTSAGEVKLLDFGIAKMLDNAADTDSTQTQHAAMTPAYAAPEQFTGGQITTATDVFSLGVLLGELITGHRHERGDSRTPSSQVTESAAAQAQITDAYAMRKRLRGDLDNIVLKATAEEPEQRYASAGSLADDIARHLHGEPVVAHPPSQLYRVSKFVSRHRGGVATTIAFLLATFSALGIALWQAREARNQSLRADAARNFVVDLLRKTSPDVAAKDRPDIPTLVYTAAESLPSELADQPELRAELLYTLGNVLRDMRDFERSEILLRDAEASSASLSRSSPVRIGTEVGLARTLIRKGKFAEAAARITPMLNLPARQLPKDSPRAVLLKIAMVIANGSDEVDQSVIYGREMLAEFRADCASGGDCESLGSAAHDLASVMIDADLMAESHALADEALRRKLHDGATPFSLANTYQLQAKIKIYLGDLDGAEASARKAMQLVDSLGNSLSRKPTDSEASLAEVLLARELGIQALAHAQAIIEDQESHNASRCDISWMEIKKVRAELLLERPEDALASSTRALEDANDCKRDVVRITTVAFAELVHAQALAANGDTAAAEAGFGRATAHVADVHSSDPLSWPQFLVESMRLAKRLGHSADAARYAHELIGALDRAGALETSLWRKEALAYH